MVDAVLGTGFKPPLKGLAMAALDWVKASKAPGAFSGSAFGVAGR